MSKSILINKIEIIRKRLEAENKITVIPGEIIGQEINENMRKTDRELAQKQAQSIRDTSRVILGESHG